MGKIDIVLQHDRRECGIACLLMIFRYYKVENSYSSIRKKIKWKEEGISLKELSRVSLEYGISANAYKVATKKIKDVKCKINFPCIALINNDLNMAHYVVIYKYKRNEVFFVDPAHGKQKMNEKQFSEVWSGYILNFFINESFIKRKKINMDEIKRYKYLMEVIKGNKKKIFGIFLLSFVGIETGILFSSYVKVIIDQILPHGNKIYLLILAFSFLSILGVDIWVSYMRNVAVNFIDAYIGKTVMNEFLHKTLRLPIEFFLSHEEGEIVSRFRDIDRLKTFYVNNLFLYTYNLFSIIITGIIMIFYNSFLSFLVIASCLFLWTFVRYESKELQSVASSYVNKSEFVLSCVLDELRNISTIKFFSCEKNFERSNIKKVEELYDEYQKYTNAAGKYNVFIQLIKGVSSVLLLSVGTAMVLDEEITIGTLMLSNTLVIYLWNPIVNLASLQSSDVIGKIAYDRINDIFEEKTELLDEEQKRNNIEGKIEFKSVSFSYCDNIVLLSNINLLIRPNCITTLIGVSGSGKSSIAKMIVGLYSPCEGKILIDDENIIHIGKRNLRRNIIYVEQETKLFNTSIYDNLKMFNSKISDAELMDLCEKVGFNKLLNELQYGWNTAVREGGANFSGGQKQMIALIRALAQKPKVLVLDEITNGMDEITEKHILNLLKEMKKDMTIFCITHKNIFLDYSDHVYSINQHIVEEVFF